MAKAQEGRKLSGKTRVKTITSSEVSSELSNSAYIDADGNITLVCINEGDSNIENMLVTLPYVPSSVKCVSSVVPEEAFPETDEGFNVESQIDLNNGITIAPYSVCVFTFSK